MTKTIKSSVHSRQIIIWLVSVSFLLFQFFLQLSSGIVIGAIMVDTHLSALQAGLLGSAFYYVYTSLQIPVGILFDRYDSRWLMAINACVCASGCFLFASGHGLSQLIIGRLVIGMGSAFAFIGLSHQLREHFPLRQYAFMVGLSETLGFTLTVFGMIGMGSFIIQCGWRSFINGAGVIGFVIAGLCWVYIPNNKPKVAKPYNFTQQILPILRNRLAWVNGLFVCLEFSVITVFSAMWAVPFLQLKMNCTIKQASILTSLTLLGAGLSCPLLGYVSVQYQKRKPIIHFSCLTTAILMLVCLYVPIHSRVTMGFLLFIIGLTCGAYMLAYSISNELAPEQFLSTCTGFTNTIAMLSAPLLQPLVGFLLDTFNSHNGPHSLREYQLALLIIPFSLVLASGLTCMLPEKKS